MTAHLFSPIEIGGLDFPNRIAVAPMCQYSADDGVASDWHLQHWMMLAMSGAGMVTVEMTDVERRGRISHGCHGLYSDACEAAARRTLDAARQVAAPGTRFGVQLAHAGRKASCRRPWEGGYAVGRRREKRCSTGQHRARSSVGAPESTGIRCQFAPDRPGRQELPGAAGR